jgi:hypothetical protein
VVLVFEKKFFLFSLQEIKTLWMYDAWEPLLFPDIEKQLTI